MRCCLLVVTSLILGAGVSTQAASEKRALDVRVDESTGEVTVLYRGTPIIQRELLQLIDTRGGWDVTFSYGKSGQVKTTGRDTPDGHEVTIEEQMPDVLSYRKVVRISPDKLAVSLDYEVAPNVTATDNFYFLGIPQELLADAPFSAVVDGRAIRGVCDLTGRGETLPPGLTQCTFYTPSAELDFEFESENARWFLADWSGTVHESLRLRVEKPIEAGGYTVHLGFTMTTRPSDPTRVARLVAEWRAENERRQRERMEKMRIIETKPLAIHSVSRSGDSVPVYEKLELTADITGTWDNPFDPDQIDVQAHFTSPSGKRIDVPGFFYHEYRMSEGGEEHVGSATWKVRFAPTETGRCEYHLTAKDRSGEVKSDVGVFAATASDSPGYVRVSKRAPLYFEFDAGAPYFPIGTNLFTRTNLGSPIPPERLLTMLRYVDGLADGGANYARLRMDAWWFSIENPPDDATGYMGIGKYHLRSAWGVDRILERARERGVYIQLCLYNPNAHINGPKEEWRNRFNFFVKEYGGPLDSIEQFWTDAEAKRLVRNKLRYVVARWGYSTALMAWEFFNEVVIRENTQDDILAWHREMSDYLHSIDSWDHLITTSPMGHSWAGSGEIWTLPNMDITQVHSYAFRDMGEGMPDFCRQAVSRHKKPFICGEFGLPRAVLDAKGLRVDQDGLHLHNGVWASSLAGSAGSAMHWYITSYIDPLDLYGRFRGLREFMKKVPTLSGDLESVRTDGLAYVEPPSPERFLDVALAGQPRFEKAAVNRFRVAPDGTINAPRGLNGFLWGIHAHRDLRNPPTFVVDYPKAGQFIVHVGWVVGTGDSPIEVYLDDKLVLEKNFTVGEGLGKEWKHIPQYDNWHSLYDEDLVVEVPAGRREIRVESLGRDRVEVSYRLVNYISSRNVVPLRIVGLANATGAYLWIQNRDSSWQARWNEVELEPVPPTSLAILGLKAGTYRVEFWDTRAGRITSATEAQSDGRRLVLAIPEVLTDIACIVEADAVAWVNARSAETSVEFLSRRRGEMTRMVMAV